MVSDRNEVVVHVDPRVDVELLEDLRRRLTRNVELDKHLAEFDSASRLMLILPLVERDRLDEELLQRSIDLALPSAGFEAGALLGLPPSVFEFGSLVAELLAQSLGANVNRLRQQIHHLADTVGCLRETIRVTRLGECRQRPEVASAELFTDPRFAHSA